MQYIIYYLNTYNITIFKTKKKTNIEMHIYMFLKNDTNENKCKLSNWDHITFIKFFFGSNKRIFIRKSFDFTLLKIYILT